ncbi:MAG: hypothetical protein AAF385_03595 [Pseudomonadota bacterium]
MHKYFFIVIALFSGLVQPVAAQNEKHWRVLKKYVQKDMHIISSTNTVFVIAHPVQKDTIRIGLDPCEACDISGVIERKRGANPYRVWVANEAFWTNEARPQSTWGQYFKASFLRILRPPSKQEG